ncbi:MAG: tyrosine-protein phosphatase [Bacteroidetes bacterium]|nr:tyrosine-protein phosphatase [Bacteroidota bacterium]
MKFCILASGLFLFTALSAFGSTRLRQPIQLGKLENLHRVDSLLYRSEQPQANDFRLLEKTGIKTVIDLRNRFNDHHELKSTGLTEIHYPINSWKINYGDLLAVLKLIRAAEKPVLIHCLHGADRTGCAVACYRMAFCNWSKEEAIREFLDPQFGYHDGWFPRMRELLETINADQLKKDLAD